MFVAGCGRWLGCNGCTTLFATMPAHASHPVCPNGLYLQVSALKPGDKLPEDLMRRFYFTPCALLRCGRYVDRIQPFLKHFKPEKCALGHCSAGWWVQWGEGWIKPPGRLTMPCLPTSSNNVCTQDIQSPCLLPASFPSSWSQPVMHACPAPPPRSIMFVEFREFCTHPERATKQVGEAGPMIAWSNAMT